MRAFRRARARNRALAAVSILCVALILQTLAPTAAMATTTAEYTEASYVNHDRANHGLRGLKLSGWVSELAHRHSLRMWSQHRLFHDCLYCLLRSNGWSVMGENVGYASSLRGMNRIFMNSPPHRANILTKGFTRMGVGVVRAGGMVWVTEIFFRP